jgi:hypothetical protein
MADRRSPLMTFVLTLLVLWLVFVVLGMVLKGLFYLTVLGLVLAVMTIAWGAFRAGRRSSR